MSAVLRLVALATGLYTATIAFRIGTALALVQLSLSPAVIGLVLATFALVPMLLAVPGGRMVDRVGVRRPIVAGSALAAAGAAGCALWLHPASLVLAAAAVGLGMMSFHLGVQHAVGEMGGPARRSANFNLLTLSFSTAGLLGPPLVGVAIDAFGHRVAFGCTAAVMALVLLGCRRFPFDAHRTARPADDASPAGPAQSPVEPAPAAPAPSAAPSPPTDAVESRESTFALLADARLRRLIAASLLASAAWDTFQFALPLHAPALGLSASSVGLAIASFSAGSLVVRLLMPRISGRMSPSRWVQLALAICVLAYATVPFASNLAVLLVLAFLVGIGPGIAQPLLMAAVHGASPPGRIGEVSGLRLTLVSAMQLSVPIGLGVVATAAGSAMLFWLYAAVAGGAGIALALAHRRAVGDQSSNGRPT